MNKIERRLSIFASILVILDVIGRNFSHENFKLLISPIFAINILEIFIILLVVIIAYNFLPSVFIRRQNIKRSEGFYSNWIEFKNIVQESARFTSSDENLHKRYEDLREKIEEDFNYFVSTIKEVQKSTHRQHNDIAIQNFEDSFSPRKLKEWHSKLGSRLIASDLDIFDYLLISLKEYYKNRNVSLLS